jgi:hypothetical protein
MLGLSLPSDCYLRVDVDERIRLVLMLSVYLHEMRRSSSKNICLMSLLVRLSGALIENIPIHYSLLTAIL